MKTTQGLSPYLGTVPKAVFGPHLHEVTCSGLDFGVRRRCGHVVDSRVPVIRDVVGRIFDNEDRWHNTSQIRVRILTYEETVSLIFYGAERRAAITRARTGEGG